MTTENRPAFSYRILFAKEAILQDLTGFKNLLGLKKYSRNTSERMTAAHWPVRFLLPLLLLLPKVLSHLPHHFSPAE
jgi:hypothetical protein